MAYQDNRRSTAAAKKAATWGTEVTPNVALYRIPMLSNTLLEQKMKVADDSINGYALQHRSFESGSVVKGEHRANLDADNLDLLTAMFFGTAGSPSQVAATSAYTNRYSILSSLEGLFFTLSIDKVVMVFTWDSVKVMGIHLSGESGKPWTISYDLVARKETLGTGTYQDSAVTTLSTATYKAKPKTAQLVWNDKDRNVFRLNAFSGGALGSSDKIYPKRFQLDMVRVLSEDHTSENSPYFDEPLDSGFIKVTGSLVFPKITAVTNLEAVQGAELKKMDISLTGAANSIETGQDYYMNFILPMVKFLNAGQPVSGPVKEEQTVQFACELPDDPSTAPTGMALTLPYVDVKNTRTTSPLA